MTMRAKLKRKTTRTVHGNKVVRLRIDVPFAALDEEGGDNQDVNKWLDNNVDSEVDFAIGPFMDEDQRILDEIEE